MVAAVGIVVVVLWIALIIGLQKWFNDELLGALVGGCGPLLILFVFSLFEYKRGTIDLWGNPKPKSPVYTPPLLRPPTERQLNFIDDLIHERDVDADDWALHKDPETLEEASATISYLLSLPYRSDADDL